MTTHMLFSPGKEKKKSICSSIPQIKSCSFLCVLYDQRIKRINWINALMYYLSHFKIICLSFTIHLYIFLTLYTYFCSSPWYTVEEINCILLWKKKKIFLFMVNYIIKYIFLCFLVFPKLYLYILVDLCSEDMIIFFQ